MLGQKDFGSKKIWLEKFWSKEILCPKYFGSKKIVGQKEFWVSKKFQVQKKIGLQKYFAAFLRNRVKSGS